MSEKQQVLILCTANSARSQMGEGLLRELAGDRFDVYSAGARPSSVNPYAVAAMRDRGLDISGHTSDHLDIYLEKEFNYVITVCDNAAESCPVFPGPAVRIHWSFPDPAAAGGSDEAILQSFADLRNGLEDMFRQWLQDLGLA